MTAKCFASSQAFNDSHSARPNPSLSVPYFRLLTRFQPQRLLVLHLMITSSRRAIAILIRQTISVCMGLNRFTREVRLASRAPGTGRTIHA
eukprot:6183975-Pleurochrysis_carterae.AAC.5